MPETIEYYTPLLNKWWFDPSIEVWFKPTELHVGIGYNNKVDDYPIYFNGLKLTNNGGIVTYDNGRYCYVFKGVKFQHELLSHCYKAKHKAS